MTKTRRSREASSEEPLVKVSLHVARSTWDALAALSAETGAPRAHYVRMLIDDYVNRLPKKNAP